jgi:hypothetical protein
MKSVTRIFVALLGALFILLGAHAHARSKHHHNRRHRYDD